MLDGKSIDEVAEFLKNSEARSDAMFTEGGELSFVIEWDEP